MRMICIAHDLETIQLKFDNIVITLRLQVEILDEAGDVIFDSYHLTSDVIIPPYSAFSRSGQTQASFHGYGVA